MFGECGSIKTVMMLINKDTPTAEIELPKLYKTNSNWHQHKPFGTAGSDPIRCDLLQPVHIISLGKVAVNKPVKLSLNDLAMVFSPPSLPLSERPLCSVS